MNIIQKDWNFPRELEERNTTDYIIVHHTAGSPEQSVDSIWQEHINIGDNGIAYHRVILKDGTTVQGRPDYSVGAHAYGMNRNSIGIVVVGYFHPDGNPLAGEPTQEQITALKENIADLKTLYPNAEVIGHRQVAEIKNNSDCATACPGDTLFSLLQEIK